MSDELRAAAKLAIVKDALRKAGYTKFWVGKNPHSTHLSSKSMIIAEPKSKNGHGVALWAAMSGMYKSSCGNGLANADQQQYFDLDIPEGEYDLMEDDHG